MSERVIILNVDDSEAPRYAKTRNLQRAGFEVAEACTGFEALKKVEELQPPVVVLDVKLPDISGIEVCGRIKNLWPRTMVLQTSATFTSGADRTRGLEGGADSYLTQPIEPDELVAAVRALLRIRSAEEELRRLNATLEERVADRTRELAAANEQLTREITQRQRAEAALVQSQKMEAVGQLTGGIAHDFNNLLTAVVGNLDLIRSRAADPRLSRLAENAYKAALRGSKLTAQLLAFSRTQQLVATAVDVAGLVRGMSELLTQTLSPSIEVIFDLPDDLPAALADANQLELAILNLAINARDAMDDSGALTIAAKRLTLGAGEPDLAPGEYIEIALTDTGSGMPPEVVARAFDPFFTTKPPGKGTGLGLSQVYGIAKQAGGNVAISSEPGMGTTVRMRLPLARGKARSPREAREVARTDATNHETILVIDDDPDVRALLHEMLREAGYDVQSSGQPEVGLEMLGGLRPDLLLLDFAMPGLNGADLARAARLIDPHLRILVLSGYADISALRATVGDLSILRKPFRPTDLLEAVRIELERPRGETGNQ